LGAISPDWRLVALTQREQDQGATLILSDLASGEEIHTMEAQGDIYRVSFSPQGQQVAANMYNVFQDLFSFWWVESGLLSRTVYDWAGFSYSPDGRFIAALQETGSGSKGKVSIFDAATFKWIKTLANDADTLWFAYPAFSPDSKVLVASYSDHVTLWDTQAWLELASLPASGPTGLVFSPDGRILTTFTQSGMVQFWGVMGGQ
jgi:WD40 repeat protein